MASIEQPRVSYQRSDWEAILSRAYTINWEVVVYGVILVIAILTRFWDLGERVMSHDESLHVYYSWKLYDQGDFQHTPLMHGPVIFHITAFFYFLFGDNDFSARIYPAILGVGIVMFPLLFRRWLGKFGAIFASIGLLISPMMMYYSRYIREDIPMLFFMLVMIYGFMQYVEGNPPRQLKWLVVMSGGMLLMMASKEVAFMNMAIYGSFLVLYWILRMMQESPLRRRPINDLAWQPPEWQTVFGHGLVLGIAVILGFFLGELLYWWQYAEIDWVWVGLGVGAVLLVRLMTLAWDALVRQTQSSSRDLINVVLSTLAILGVLLAMFGSYQHYDKGNAIESIEAKTIQEGFLTEAAGTARRELSDQRDLAEGIGFAGLLIAVFTITGLMFTYVMTTTADGQLVLNGKLKRKRKNEDVTEEAPSPTDNMDGMNWLITTVAVVLLAGLILAGLRWLSTDVFTYWLRRLPDQESVDTAFMRLYFPLIKHTILDFGAMLVIYLGLNSIGFIRTFLAEEPRPGVAQMLTDGLTRTKSTLFLVMAGTIIGGVLALHIFGVLDILKPDQIFFRPTQTTMNAETGETITYPGQIILNEELGNALLVWVGLPILLAIGVVIITAMLATPRRMSIPWMDILAVLLVAIIVGGILVYAERHSHLEEDTEEDEQPVAVDPNQPTLNQPQEKYEKGIIYAATGFALLLALGVMLWRVYFPYTWDYLERQPVFGVLITLGALLLPWLSALPIWLAGYKLDAAPLPDDTAKAAFLVTGSWLILSFTVAISWNWRYWLVAVTVFLGLFVFFFTTVFTNGAGVLTGMVGSLGYWLEQQGVRRGSQPQYYYTLIQVPIYEFLPLVLTSLAGLLGLGYVFRWRAVSREVELAEIGQDIHERNRVQTAPLDMHAIMEDQPPLPGSYRPRRQTDRLIEVEAEPLIEVERSDPMAIFDEDTPEMEQAGFQPMQAPPPFWARPYDQEEEMALRTSYHEWLGGVPFLPLLGYWAIIIFVGLTYAGEKMPWLTTHITVPMTLIAGWFVGMLVEKIRWESLKKGGWALLLVLVPVLLISLVELIFPLIGREQPFQGTSQNQLHTTYEWLAALLVFLGVGYYSARMIDYLGWGQTWRIAFASLSLLLAVLAGRAAFMASFKNYDYPTEYLVYAHSGPNVKDTLAQIDYIASRMNEGTNLRVAFDDDSSWPMTWYLRDYNTAYFGGSAEDLQNNPGVLSGARVVIVGGKKNEAVERILGDQYYRYDLIRLWWPMQEYFNLNHERVMNLFEDAESNPVAEIYRQGIWNIWWERDYELYSVAQCVERQQLTCEENGYSAGCMNQIIQQCEGEDNRYDLRQWPVSDAMYVYIDKDYVTEIWDAGIGGESVENREPVDAIGRVFSEIEPMNIFGTAYSLRKPRGIEVADNGNVYVADTENSRIMVFDPAGNLVTTFGVPSTQDNIGPGTLFQPWGVAIAEDGRVYVADTWNHRVAVFDSAGVPITMWGYYGTPESMPNDPYAMFGPRDIEIDLSGNILIADTGGKRIRVYTPDGQWRYDIGGGGSSLGQLEEPVGIAVNPVSGHIFVADTWNRRIQEFEENGNPVRYWEVEMWFDNRNSSDRPYLAFSPDGTLLAVSDMNSSGRNEGPRIVVYDLAGTPVMALNAPETNFESGQFGLRIVAGLAFSPDGTLYALDADTGRVLRFPALPVQGSVLPVPRQEVEQPPAQDNLALPTEEPTEEPAAEATEELSEEPTAEPTEEATEVSAG